MSWPIASARGVAKHGQRECFLGSGARVVVGRALQLLVQNVVLESSAVVMLDGGWQFHRAEGGPDSARLKDRTSDVFHSHAGEELESILGGKVLEKRVVGMFRDHKKFAP